MARTAAPRWPTADGSVFFDEVASRPTLAKAASEGRIRRLAVGVFSADMASSDEALVASNRFKIIARFIPDALLVDRTAAEGGVVTGGRMFVGTEARSTTLKLPGLDVVVRATRPLDEPVRDPEWTGGLRISSNARTLIDNLSRSRSDGVVSRTLSLTELEEWVGKKLVLWGERRVERLRQEAHEVAAELGLQERLEALDGVFAAIRNSGPVRRNASPLTKAIRAGRAWDIARVEHFERLAAELATTEQGDEDEPTYLPEPAVIGELPFWESYMSNFIEGTEFTVDEARRIVDTREVPANRPADGHDILGTYLCVADPVGRASSSEDPEELIVQLRARHRSMLERRSDIGPGEWKTEPNKVGTYYFVDPDLVEGTLLEGFKFAASVPRGFKRALYLMYVVSETHPFTDGNGRTARVMANAELSAVGQSRIVIPIVYRNEYLSGLRRLSREQDPVAYRRIMAFAWRWTASMPWDDKATCDGKMQATHALDDSNEAAERGFRLELP